MSTEVKPVCGIVMPISAIDGLDESHWVDVLAIISDAALIAGYEANVASNADDVGVIQKRIVQNLYTNEIVVCDVSGKNPNVMFELGMRLAFDKPTIIIKDDKTSYSFDTSPIEHLTYPRDLRFARIVEFKSKLANKIASTVKASKESDEYSPFLKHFGEFKVAKIETKEVGGQEIVFDEIRSLRKMVERIHRLQEIRSESVYTGSDIEDNIITLSDLSEHQVNLVRNFVDSHPNVFSARSVKAPSGATLVEFSMPGVSAQVRNLFLKNIDEYISHVRSQTNKNKIASVSKYPTK